MGMGRLLDPAKLLGRGANGAEIGPGIGGADIVGMRPAFIIGGKKGVGGIPMGGIPMGCMPMGCIPMGIPMGGIPKPIPPKAGRAP
mmetsp:Transcript_71737/g.149773  ORF Transcript_71737/g.149773 Transcript_71737/m.149773 type:complete len:86 (+) Transcript_71737:898-1155(+)